MNQTGRRIAALVASLLFAVSTAGLLFGSVFADESPEGTEPTVIQVSGDPDPTEGSTPETEESRPGTDPEIPPTEGEETEDTSEGEETDPAETTSETPETGTEDSTDEEGSDPATVPTTGEPETDDQTATDPSVTTGPVVTTSATTTTTFLSKNPVISTAEAVSEEPIGLSTEKGDRPADSDDAQGEVSPGDQSGTLRETDEIRDPDQLPDEEDDRWEDPEADRSGIRQVSIVCSVFALLSGAVLVLLKFIR